LLQLTAVVAKTPLMNFAKKPLLFALLTIALGLLFAGCVGVKNDASIPWNRPADWEGQIPGMGTAGR
jgi:hypothetical protein